MPENVNSSMCWFFPSTQHGSEDGFNDPLIQYFEGNHEHYIARETIQNAVDVRLDPGKPVRVVFERLVIPTADLPGVHELSHSMSKCPEFIAGQKKAESFFNAALSVLAGPQMSMLKISDFNTSGLTGADDDRAGNWYRLVRAIGVNSPHGAAGGSFGIGKGAAFAASSLHTVFYSSINAHGESVFQGTARLVSHYDEEHDVRRGIGFYGVDGHRAVRDASLIPPRFKRTEQGSDIFVMDYKSEGDWRTKLISSVLHNFWLAIHSGDLEVEFRDEGNEPISLTSSTLKHYLDESGDSDTTAFYLARIDPTKTFTTNIKHLGEVTFHVRKQEKFPYKIMMARKPLMRVKTKTSYASRDVFAGVLICTTDEGNELLRQLEPPAHDKWDPERHEFGGMVIRSIDRFIKESLESMEIVVHTRPEDIPGLAQYLPNEELRDLLPDNGMRTEPTTGEHPIDEQTGRPVGALKPSTPAPVVPIKRQGTITKLKPGKIGERSGFSKGSSESQGPVAGNPGEDMENAMISTSDIEFRSYAQTTGERCEYRLILRGNKDCEGAISLIAIGDDNSYPVNIVEAKNMETKENFEVSASMIKGLSLHPGKSIQVSVTLSSNRKYAIGLKSYES